MPLTKAQNMIELVPLLFAGGVGMLVAEKVASFLFTLASLTICSIIVFYVKKWLEKEDSKINKDGGLVDFIKRYLKKKYEEDCKNECKDDETNK